MIVFVRGKTDIYLFFIKDKPVIIILPKKGMYINYGFHSKLKIVYYLKVRI
jgi:hypothetical protein